MNPSLNDLDNLLIKLIEDVQCFGEFILDQEPNSAGTDVIAKMISLSNSIKDRSITSLSLYAINKLQNEILSFYIGWNTKISKQVLNFYNAYVKIIDDSHGLLFQENDNPFIHILKNLRRFDRANAGIEGIIKKYDFKSVDEIEFYSYFFAVIIMSESQRYYFQKDLEERLGRRVSEFKIHEIFSLTKPWKNEDGNLRPDITMLRNAIAHFKFKTEYDEENIDLKIIFFPEPEKYEETRILYAHEIVDFVGNYRYLLQTFENVLFLMFIFSLIRHLYIKN